MLEETRIPSTILPTRPPVPPSHNNLGLQASNSTAQQLAAIVESSDDAILTKDLNGTITSWNRGAEQLFGYTAEEAIGRSVTMLIPDDRIDEEPDILQRLRRGEKIDHYETVRQRKDGSHVHISLSVSPLRDENGSVTGAAKIARDITDRQYAQEQQRLLLQEMQHRIKNVFAMASGLVSLCVKRAETPGQLAQMVRERLEALARAHALTVPAADSNVDDTPQTATLHELTRTILSPHLDPTECNRLRVLGDDLTLSSRIITPLALVLNELATNAVKHGALSVSTGTVTLESRREGDQIIIRWNEQGGPIIGAQPDHHGFGTRLSEIAVERQLNGRIQRQWDPAGLSITLILNSASLDLP
jgi:PAS domain S-box-containing protein